MSQLDERLQKFITEKFGRDQLVLMLILHKLQKHGIRLNTKQREQLKEQISTQLSEDLDGRSILRLNLDDALDELHEINLEITDEDLAELKNLLHSSIEEIVLSTTSELAQHLLVEWKKHSQQLLREQRAYQNDFNQRLRSHWGKGLDLLDILIGTSLEAGMSFNHDYRPEASAQHDLVFEALTRLHARGSQIAREIHVLLSHGLADGAHARWRTLHEVAVVASFVKEHGNDVAERYLLHSWIETYTAALEYQRHCIVLGLQPLTDDELDHLRQQRQRLLSKFGDTFKYDYGWATSVLGDRRLTFSDIEQNSSLEHLRPFVKLAHSNVHASAKGASHRLGLYPSAQMLLAGPSVFGLGDPGRNTAYSTMLLTTTLLLLRPTIEHIAHVNAMRTLHQEIHDAFYEAEDELEHRREFDEPGNTPRGPNE